MQLILDARTGFYVDSLNLSRRIFVFNPNDGFYKIYDAAGVLLGNYVATLNGGTWTLDTGHGTIDDATKIWTKGSDVSHVRINKMLTIDSVAQTVSDGVFTLNTSNGEYVDGLGATQTATLNGSVWTLPHFGTIRINFEHADFYSFLQSEVVTKALVENTSTGYWVDNIERPIFGLRVSDGKWFINGPLGYEVISDELTGQLATLNGTTWTTVTGDSFDTASGLWTLSHFSKEIVSVLEPFSYNGSNNINDLIDEFNLNTLYNEYYNSSAQKSFLAISYDDSNGQKWETSFGFITLNSDNTVSFVSKFQPQPGPSPEPTGVADFRMKNADGYNVEIKDNLGVQHAISQLLEVASGSPNVRVSKDGNKLIIEADQLDPLDLHLQGTTTIDAMTVSGAASMQAVSAASMTTSGSFSVGSDMTVSGASNLQALTATDVNASTMTSSGAASVGGDMTVLGSSRVQDLTIDGAFNVSDDKLRRAAPVFDSPADIPLDFPPGNIYLVKR